MMVRRVFAKKEKDKVVIIQKPWEEKIPSNIVVVKNEDKTFVYHVPYMRAGWKGCYCKGGGHAQAEPERIWFVETNFSIPPI